MAAAALSHADSAGPPPGAATLNLPMQRTPPVCPTGVRQKHRIVELGSAEPVIRLTMKSNGLGAQTGKACKI